MFILVSFIAALALAAIHLWAGKLEFLMGKPRNIWLSASGGLSVAFVFLYLLPELSTRQEQIKQPAIDAGLSFLAHHVYIVALAGMIAFYGLERVAKASSARHAAPNSNKRPRPRVFWAHVASFALYNVVIGYMLVEKSQPGEQLILFFVAMALHFLVIDFSFRDHYQHVYHEKGRWLLSIAVIVGWLAGILFNVPDVLVGVAVAFVAGGIILNALKEELPEERQSRFLPFLFGAGGYTSIALAYAKWKA